MNLFRKQNGSSLNVAVQLLSVFFAGLYVLSAVRGFAPVVCPVEDPVAIFSQKTGTFSAGLNVPSSCCQYSQLPVSDNGEQDSTGSSATCILCVLSNAHLEESEHYHFSEPEFSELELLIDNPVLAYIEAIPSILHDRAPPA